MSAHASLLFYFPGVAFKRYALPTLVSFVGEEDAKRIWVETLQLQKTSAQQRPRHSFGTNLVLRYMEWDSALYRAARRNGVPAIEAARLIEEINWKAFGPMTATLFRFSRVRSPHLRERVKWILDLMFRVLFTHPFRRNTFPLTNEVAFDVVTCPLATYFKDQGVPELTSSAACSLDYRMAAVWGVTLWRTQTIANGDQLCDFRFRTKLTGVPAAAPQGSDIKQ